ncbi:MAG: methylenetetrahydrofolate reductase C-terminal domain-containing protein [Deltaproteobacteria bacterium]|nr:methylenetetrahydrofolate reductase C-terminal domain-containing protein [Deltaproteobacteria bacterium]MBW2661521.1 methylenetetrahydrofolate reductase C-terminal domain-containing protein [Deltaproteobacteria bacterium]
MNSHSHKKNKFKDSLLNKKVFTITCELVPGRGSRSKVQDKLLVFAEKAALGGQIQALSITENAGGHPALSPEVLGREILKLGIDPLVHLTCKDRNRNQLESRLFAHGREEIYNLLIMGGDYPRYGFKGFAKPVFDLDTVQLVKMADEMTRGFEVENNAPGGGSKLPPIPFFKGCVISPFKKLEAELMTQYFKLRKKITAGADFLVTQVGFDARKHDELLRYMRQNNLSIPILGNVYIPSKTVASVMHQGLVPGCIVTDKLMAIYEQESRLPDKGKKNQLIRAAKLFAILKGIGFDGVHIGGSQLTYEDIEFVLEKGEKFYPDWKQWTQEFSFPQENSFYYYKADNKTGLNTNVLVDRHQSIPRRSASYRFNRLVHKTVFDKRGWLYHPAKNICRKISGTFLERLFTQFEYLIKFIGFECRMCGDCTLSEAAFLCPQSQCAKYLLNGPCGGSRDGWCEVYPGIKRCIYVQAYERLKSFGEEEKLKENIVPPRNWSLNRNSSWINYFMGKEHEALKKYL